MQTQSPASPPLAAVLRKRPAIPSWVMSVALHLMLLVMLAMAFRAAPTGSAEPPARGVEIVLKQPDKEGGSQYADAKSAANAASANNADVNSAVLQSLKQPPDVNLPGALPGATEEQQVSLAGEGLVVGAGNLTSGVGRAGLPGEPLPVPDESGLFVSHERPRVGPPAEIELWGIPAKGHMFVFVVDRSRSMGRGMNYVLEAAKARINTCLSKLGENHQFQIVFYNQRPSVFAGGEAPHATEANKRKAREFIKSMTPAGQTQHDLAMMAALRLKPDVIFLLTDAHPPGLNRLDLNLIRDHANNKIAIHTIEFGFGKPLESDNFLRVLARENNGSYVYVDVEQPLRK